MKIVINTNKLLENQKAILEEINSWFKFSNEYVIQYFDSWIENNNCLYIQMELCSDNLQNIIQQMPQILNAEKSEPMKPIEYFISCQIFKELLECVQYLHESNPPVIHGNLKLENVLISEFPINGKFLKLCDLKFENLSHNYAFFDDINCLGYILQNIFNFAINS